MKHFRYIALIILLHPILTFGQVTTIDSNHTGSKYDKIKYEIINVDTIVTHYASGKYNTPDFKRWDSTKIWAHIILQDLPKKIDPVSLKKKVEKIMKDKGINKASVFRDIYSSKLFRLSSSYAAEKLKEADGYLGQFNVD